MTRTRIGVGCLVLSFLPACGRVVVSANEGVDGRADVASENGGGDGPLRGGVDSASDALPDHAGADTGLANLDAGAGGDAALTNLDAGAGGDAAVDVAVSGPPTVTSNTPLNLATNVSINARPTATFSRAMDPTTLDAQSFTVTQGQTPVVGVVTLDALTNTATFTPNVPLGLGMVFTLTITTGAKALGGAALAASHAWTFTTSACSQAPVDLRSASGFAVLAGSTITSTGPTTVTGDVGVSPGTAITGFPPAALVGAQHPGDPAAAQAIADVTTAYDDAKARTLCPISVAGDLSGRTLTPGLYKSTSSLDVSTGNLVLDGQGDGEAVFIFQMASTLTTTDGRQVMLIGGANAAHVYWQVGTSATLGTTSVFAGTIMADQSITLMTGATLNGRALARVAAVTLDSNAIVKPAP
jgi:Ice-binding-like/Bacterial Ig-like domain